MVKLLEEERLVNEEWTESMLIDTVIKNAKDKCINLKNIDPKYELQYLIDEGLIEPIDKRIKGIADPRDTDIYEYYNPPKLKLTRKGKRFYHHARVKCIY